MTGWGPWVSPFPGILCTTSRWILKPWYAVLNTPSSHAGNISVSKNLPSGSTDPSEVGSVFSPQTTSLNARSRVPSVPVWQQEQGAGPVASHTSRKGLASDHPPGHTAIRAGGWGCSPHSTDAPRVSPVCRKDSCRRVYSSPHPWAVPKSRVSLVKPQTQLSPDFSSYKGLP